MSQAIQNGDEKMVEVFLENLGEQWPARLERDGVEWYTKFAKNRVPEIGFVGI
jgi:hypothetical protein